MSAERDAEHGAGPDDRACCPECGGPLVGVEGGNGRLFNCLVCGFHGAWETGRVSAEPQLVVPARMSALEHAGRELADLRPVPMDVIQQIARMVKHELMHGVLERLDAVEDRLRKLENEPRTPAFRCRSSDDWHDHLFAVDHGAPERTRCMRCGTWFRRVSLAATGGAYEMTLVREGS